MNIHIFQPPFNSINYELIGDDTGPSYFTIDTESGGIAVRSGVDLPADSEVSYVVSVIIYANFV